MMGKKPKGRKRRPINYDLPYRGAQGKSMDREIARRKWESRATPEEMQLGSTLSRDESGNFIRKTKLESKAEYKNGGVITGVSPLIILSQKIAEMMKGEEEPLIIPRAPEPSPHIPPADSTETSKQKDILTGLVVARLLQGRR